MATGLGVKKKPTETGFRVILTLACIVVIVSGLRAASELLVPVAMGLFLSVLSLPILNWLHGKRIPRPLAIGMTIGFNLLILFALVLLASSTIQEFQDKKDDYASALKERVENFAATIDANVERMGNFFDQDDNGKADPGEAPESAEPRERRTFNELVIAYWDNKIILEFLGQTELLGRITSLASKSFFVLVIMIFVLGESGRYAGRVREVIRAKGPDLRRFQNSSRDLQKYLAIKTVASAVTGFLAWFVCWLIEVDFPVLWGLVAFIFNYIPAIGSIIAAIPPIILAMIDLGFAPALMVAVCYLVINMTIGNFLEPMLLGDRFGISTVVVILSVLFWGYVWGPVGMFLAIPLTMMVKVMLDNSTDLKWISVLMGNAKQDSERRKAGAGKEGGAESLEPAAPGKKEPA